jgi:hypothetical protein
MMGRAFFILFVKRKNTREVVRDENKTKTFFSAVKMREMEEKVVPLQPQITDNIKASNNGIQFQRN